MVQKRFTHIAVIAFLLSTLVLLQLPQIHSHPATPVEPSRCPVVLVNSNATGIAPPLLMFQAPVQTPILILTDFIQLTFFSHYLPSALILRAPPVC